MDPLLHKEVLENTVGNSEFCVEAMQKILEDLNLICPVNCVEVSVSLPVQMGGETEKTIHWFITTPDRAYRGAALSEVIKQLPLKDTELTKLREYVFRLKLHLNRYETYLNQHKHDTNTRRADQRTAGHSKALRSKVNSNFGV